DPRALILLGLVLTAWSLALMSGFTTFMPVRPIVVSGMIQGFGLGFIFVPLSTLSYATLAPRYRSEAAALFSLVRNLGSSIGVSAAVALLGRNIQIQHSYLAENITSYAFWLDPRRLGTGES